MSDRKIVEYTIVTGFDSSSLGKSVNFHLKNGWTLYGDLVVTKGKGAYLFSQAMVRYET
jgi:hypothetical protein